MNYREIYEWGKNELCQAQIAEAALDARLLLEHICHTGRHDLLAHGERSVTAAEEAAYQKSICCRAGHVPLQHIIGVQEFMGLEFQVNERVLIPRQDTEVLVEEVMKSVHDGMRILDMCTGTGCILLSLLHYSNGCAGVGVDRSEEALALAGENARRLALPARFVQSDLFAALPEGERYDIIVSNPPYIPTAVIDGLMPEVREHEPAAALDGGEDGLSFYRKITQDAGRFLYPGGFLFYEIGCEQGRAVSAILKAEGYKDIRVIKDFAGLDRVVCGSLWTGWDNLGGKNYV